VVDVEIRRYGVEDKIAALMRKLNLPQVTTFMGRGLLEHAPDVVAGTGSHHCGVIALGKLVAPKRFMAKGDVWFATHILTRKLARKGCSCRYETLLPFCVAGRDCSCAVGFPPAPTANRQSTKVGNSRLIRLINRRHDLFFLV